MASLEKALVKTFEFEGGYANDPNDKGKETYRGISRVSFPNWSGWHIVDAMKLNPAFPAGLESNTELSELVQDLYQTQIWNGVHGDDIASQELADVMFDSAVNSGQKRAVALFQYAHNLIFSDHLDVDGKLGPDTAKVLTTLTDKDGDEIAYVLNAAHGGFYLGLIAADPDMERYQNSWLRRTY